MLPSKKRREHGFTLLELVLVLAGISALSVSGFFIYKQIDLKNQTSVAVEDSRLLSNILMQTYGQAGSFEELSNKSLINGNLLPANFNIQNGTIQNHWGGGLNVGPADNNNVAFSLRWDSVPSGACSNMTSQLSKNFAQIQVNGTDVKSPSVLLDIPSVTRLCGVKEKNVVTLISNQVALPNSGEVSLPKDRGAPPALPKPSPDTLSSTTVDPVNPVTAVLPLTLLPRKPYTTPTVSAPSVGSGVGTVSAPSIATALPPTTALPPQTCFPSTIPTPITTTEYADQTLACQAGYGGAIVQQQSRSKTVTNTTTVTCATPWSPPSVSTSSATTYGTWSAWTTTANTCAPMCSTQLPSYAPHYNYQWVTINNGCPAGYIGQNSYDAQQYQISSASCPNPSATSAPVYGGWSGWMNTGATQNYVYTCVPSMPTMHDFVVGIWGGYQWTEGKKVGMGTCNLATTFNTFVLWSADQGNPADYYVATLSRAGQNLSWTISKSQVQCAVSCSGVISMPVSTAKAVVPEIDWSTLVYDHTVTNGTGGVAIYPWMMNATVTLKACNNAGVCSTATETSLDVSVFSNGQRDCQAMQGGTGNYPSTAHPPGDVR